MFMFVPEDMTFQLQALDAMFSDLSRSVSSCISNSTDEKDGDIL
jgi:hypothetical protein